MTRVMGREEQFTCKVVESVFQPPSPFMFRWQSVSAFPGLVARGDCDSFACPPSPGDVYNGIVGAGAAVVGGATWLGNEFLDLFQPPEPPGPQTSATPATPVIPGQGETNSDDAQQSSEPTADINLLVIGTPTPQSTNNEECQSPSISDEDPGSDQIAPITSSCEIATAQLVFLSSCDDLAQNRIIQDMLEEMEISNEKTDGVLVSMAPMCATADGADFIMTDLTPSQIQTTRKTTDDDPTDENEPGTGPATKKGNSLKKRDDVVLQAGAYPHLRFLSTGKLNDRVSENYAYFLSAGPRITTYVVERGLSPAHDEFTGVSIDWIIALTASASKADVKGFHGTCMCSLIVGRRFGVYKDGDLVLIKIGARVGSALNGLAQMIMRLRAKMLRGENVEGYTVLNISGSFEGGADNIYIIRLKEYLSTLMRVFQVVVVTAAGNAPPQTGGPIYEWPALSSLDSDVITVGSVSAVTNDDLEFGQKYPGSRVGPALTISAPSQVQCARSALFRRPGFFPIGTSVSTAIVSGLVGYFLNLPLGDQLREKENIPLAVKEYIKRKGFARYRNDLAVWNGLDADNPGQNNQYGWDGQYGLEP